MSLCDQTKLYNQLYMHRMGYKPIWTLSQSHYTWFARAMLMHKRNWTHDLLLSHFPHLFGKQQANSLDDSCGLIAYIPNPIMTTVVSISSFHS